MQSGSKPVAIGSSVPRWPMLFSRCARLTSRTTPAEVMPPGLSTSRIPSSVIVALVALAALVVGVLVVALGAQSLQQRIDAAGAGEVVVVREHQLRRVTQI